ncbi:hypothetical protein [Streptomyces sp. NPDC020996]|uniref:hypothetical protein n=1 Tax=Streptomyces sp. NPDC020996 TaxID=3154791 RepID=UPI0033D9D351
MKQSETLARRGTSTRTARAATVVVVSLGALLASTVPAGASTADSGSHRTVTSASGRQAYVVKGKVTTVGGKPIKGAKIVVDDTLHWDSNLVAMTNKQGTYRVGLPHKAGTWKASGYLSKRYHGRNYQLSLWPSSLAPFEAKKGAVRDFKWKLTGKRKGEEGRYYGGIVSHYLWSDNAPDDEWLDNRNVRLTLKPVTKLIDGSTGKTISNRKAVWVDPYGWSTVDVPVGRYKITAKYVVPGKPDRDLLVKETGAESFATSVTSDFFQDVTSQRIRLDVMFPAS